jgi:hypothetical protein
MTCSINDGSYGAGLPILLQSRFIAKAGGVVVEKDQVVV